MFLLELVELYQLLKALTLFNSFSSRMIPGKQPREAGADPKTVDDGHDDDDDDEVPRGHSCLSEMYVCGWETSFSTRCPIRREMARP